MIDPLLSLVFSIHANKGVYAFLLGSGVSRSAGIPTGWEITLDLIQRLAHLKGEECKPDPTAWYIKTFDKEPDYSELLHELAKSSSERSMLLRGYFEPNEEEREQGLKRPTEAHKAIAELVQAGYVRVIVTTNFDRLIEQALEEIGIVPTVISTPDAVDGALPLTHTECSIIKVHGDYLDVRVKNSPQELEQYDERMDQLLDRVFDEFGLIICGWSAVWDTALRAALERCKSRRYTTYWTMRGKPHEVAQNLIGLRQAQMLSIQDADIFFRSLTEKISALSEFPKAHPLSSKMAVASLKRYIVDERHRIRLADMVTQEVETAYSGLSEANFPVENVGFNAQELGKRLQKYEAVIEVLQALLTAGCYWGNSPHEQLWVKALERVGNPSGDRNGITGWLYLKAYPALVLLYSGGIAAIAAGNYDTLSVLYNDPRYLDIDSKELPLIYHLNDVRQTAEYWKQLPGLERHYTPISDHLYGILREPLRDYLPSDMTYQGSFDRFEYLSALVCADFKEKRGGGVWGPIGCFGWRYRHSDFGRSIMSVIDSEVHSAGNAWPPLSAGLFGGSVERFREIKSAFDKMVSALPWH